jgi:hypothetical protein
MRKIVLLAVISLVAAPVAAEQQATPQQDNQTKAAVPAKKPADGKQENSYEWRIRTEGSAGGTAPAPEQEREGVGAGAKEHMRFDQLDRGLHRRSDAEVIAPSK